MLLFCITLLTSTISIIIRDFQQILQFIMRMMFFILPLVWDTSKLSNFIETILKLNPFYYIIEGFRDTFLGRKMVL